MLSNRRKGIISMHSKEHPLPISLTNSDFPNDNVFVINRPTSVVKESSFIVHVADSNEFQFLLVAYPFLTAFTLRVNIQNVLEECSHRLPQQATIKSDFRNLTLEFEA